MLKEFLVYFVIHLPGSVPLSAAHPVYALIRISFLSSIFNTIFLEIMHCFEIRTANIDYFVGQDPLYNLQDGNMVNLPPPDSGVGAYLAKSWESSIRQAIVPVQANASK